MSKYGIIDFEFEGYELEVVYIDKPINFLVSNLIPNSIKYSRNKGLRMFHNLGKVLKCRLLDVFKMSGGQNFYYNYCINM